MSKTATTNPRPERLAVVNRIAALFADPPDDDIRCEYREVTFRWLCEAERFLDRLERLSASRPRLIVVGESAFVVRWVA